MNLSLSNLAIGGTISYEALRDRCLDLVAEKGDDFTGTPGRYFRGDGSPGCLLGELAARDGATKSQLDIAGVNMGGVSHLVELGYLVPTDERTLNALSRLQMYNDQGATWYTAVKFAFELEREEMRRQIELRRQPVVQIDADAYVDWVASYGADQAKPVTKVTVLHPHQAKKTAVEHVLVA